MKTSFSLALASTILCGAAAQAPAPSGGPTLAPEDAAQDYGWPRPFETAEYEGVLHQPQVDEWPDFARITFRAAVGVRRKGTEEQGFGTIQAHAATQVSVSDRLRLLFAPSVAEGRFPSPRPGGGGG